MAFRLGCKIICNNLENEFSAIRIHKNYHHAALRYAYNYKNRCYTKDEGLHRKTPQFEHAEKFQRNYASSISKSSPFAAPTNNFSTNRNSNDLFSFSKYKSSGQNTFSAVNFRDMSAVPERLEDFDTYNDYQLETGGTYFEQEPEVVGPVYNRFQLPPIRDTKTMNHIAFNQNHKVDITQSPGKLDLHFTYPVGITRNQVPNIKISPRGMRHQFNLEASKKPKESFFGDSDLLSIDDYIRSKKKQQECPKSERCDRKKDSYSGSAYRKYGNEFNACNNPTRGQSKIKTVSKMGYAGGDIWNKSKHASRFGVDSETFKVNCVDQRKSELQQTQSNYHVLASNQNCSSNITKRLNLLLTQDIAKKNAKQNSSYSKIQGILDHSRVMVDRSFTSLAPNRIGENKAKQSKWQRGFKAQALGSQLSLSVIPIPQGGRCRKAIKTWCFKPKNHRKDIGFFSNFLKSCYKTNNQSAYQITK